MPDHPGRTDRGAGPASRADRTQADLAPGGCTPRHACGVHDTRHVHDGGCGHPALGHDDHVDYEVEGHRHRPHEGHCDDHGPARP